MNKYRFVDLFCGCGGFSLGFEAAGFKGLLGIDIWDDAVTTYNYNFQTHKALTCDITELSSSDLLEYTGVKQDDIDLIIGGPPCQGFSLSGKRLLTDPRNKLYQSFVRIVNDLQPKSFVMENVPGLVRLFDGKVMQTVLSDFTEAGFEVKYKVLSSEEYGVPQIRKRVFIVGINKQKVRNFGDFLFPVGEYGEGKKPLITCRDAISDLDFISDEYSLPEVTNYVKIPESDYQRIMRTGTTLLYNHAAIIHTAQTKSIIALVPDGGNYKDLPAYLQNTRKVNIAWTRMMSSKPCFTIDTGHNHHFHYSENRVPTVRESARIQSFPDSFMFLGRKSSQLRQVGNAVPPLMAKAVADQVLKIIMEDTDDVRSYKAV